MHIREIGTVSEPAFVMKLEIQVRVNRQLLKQIIGIAV